MTLKKGILWSQKKMRPQNVKRSGKYQGVMGKLMSNEKIAKALDRPGERKEFYGMLKSVSEGGVYKNELRKFFGDLRSGKLKTRTINAKELRIIAKEIFPDSAKRYTFKESRPQKNTPSPGQNVELFNEIRRGFSSSGGTQTKFNTPQNVVAFRHETVKPEKQYTPGKSLNYEFAKTGLQSTKEPAKKKDVEIKPVAPEVYAKIPGTSQKTTKDDEKTSTASPEATKTKPVGNYSPLDDRLKYEYEKQDSPGMGAADSSLKNKSPNTLAKMAPLMNIVRKKMLADKEDEASGEKRSFFRAIAATKNKRS